MQSIFRRAWQLDPTDKKPDKASLPKQMMRPSSLVDISSMIRMKRKRSESPNHALSSEQENVKRIKLVGQEETVHSAPGYSESDDRTLPKSSTEGTGLQATSLPSVPPGAETPETPMSSHLLLKSESCNDQPSAAPDTEMSTKNTQPTASSRPRGTANENTHELRNIIEHQVNLEILFKHRELRLIEQELAKCQVALEQLRRCEIVPYPGSNGLDPAISMGSGPSLKAPSGSTQPQAPAPWGVTDGPYTRHYARWLLNDSTFDAMPFPQTQPSSDYFSTMPEGRATRNSGTGLGRASKSRPSRDSVGNFSHALPNYPMNARGKGGPLVIKRMADNQFVKLICNNCQRGDFSSVQGFLNHCRIAHKVDYKSHEAAATDCGRPLEANEAHLVPPTTPAAIPAAKPPGPKAAVAPGAPSAPVAQPLPIGSVHPLNMPIMPQYTWKVQAAAARIAAAASNSSTPSSVSAKRRPTSLENATPAVKSFRSTPLIASSATPHLSTQFAKHGLGGDLKAIIARAREQIDLGSEADNDDDSSAAPSRKQSISQTTPALPASRYPFAAGGGHMGPSQSRKGHLVSASRPRPAPLISRAAGRPSGHGETMEIPESPQDSTLSPHTADSNPGLVSDHEDDDAASELDEVRSERHASPDPPLAQLGAMRRGISACGPDVDVEFEDDGDGHHGVLIRPRGLAFQEFTQRPSGNPSQRPISRFGGGGAK